MRPRLHLIFVFLCALSFEAFARGSIRLDSCIVTWGRFCPIETVGAAVAVVAAFFFVGVPFRIYGEREFQAGRIAEDEARMKRGIFLIKWSTYLGLATVALFVLMVVA